ncbi:hypothetical protein GEMRC1_000011 [Eukaryota sp. GEM-RC1]
MNDADNKLQKHIGPCIVKEKMSSSKYLIKTGTSVAVVLGIGAIVVTSKGILTPKIKGILWPLVKLNPIPVHARDAAQKSVCHWFNSMLPVGMDMILGYTSDTYNDQNTWCVRFAMPDSPTANTGRTFQMIFREVEHVRSKKGEVTCVQYTPHHKPQCFESEPVIC